MGRMPWISKHGIAPAGPSTQRLEPFDYELIPAGYYDAAFRRGRGVQSKWHHLKFERVERELAGCRRVLDVGCGPGTLSGNFTAHEWTGADLSTRQIDYARRTYGRGGARFYRATARELPGGERDFDAVTLVEVIEHLEPPVLRDTLGGALERLRPGGKVVVTTPNFESAWPWLEAVVNHAGGVSYRFQHVNRFSRRRLVALLAEHRLEHVAVEPYLFAAPFLAAVSWRLADRVARLERRGLERRAGLLLIGTAHKPA